MESYLFKRTQWIRFEYNQTHYTHSGKICWMLNPIMQRYGYLQFQVYSHFSEKDQVGFLNFVIYTWICPMVSKKVIGIYNHARDSMVKAKYTDARRCLPNVLWNTRLQNSATTVREYRTKMYYSFCCADSGKVGHIYSECHIIQVNLMSRNGFT